MIYHVVLDVSLVSLTFRYNNIALPVIGPVEKLGKTLRCGGP